MTARQRAVIVLVAIVASVPSMFAALILVFMLTLGRHAPGQLHLVLLWVVGTATLAGILSLVARTVGGLPRHVNAFRLAASTCLGCVIGRRLVEETREPVDVAVGVVLAAASSIVGALVGTLGGRSRRST